MQGAGTWPVSMSQEQPHQCQAAAIAACRLRRQRLPLEPTSVGCLVAESLMARAAGRMRQASPDQNAHNSTDFRPADFASSIQDWGADAGERFFIRCARQGGAAERKAMIDRGHALPLVRQAELLRLSRSSVYYEPRPVPAAELAIMRRIDELHLEHPFAGSRMLRDLLRGEGVAIGRDLVATLMRRMGIEALYRRPGTSAPAPGHKVYPYLL